MIEIEAKTRLRAGEGAHFFFTLIFLVATGLIEREYTSESCEVNLRLLVDLLFYSQIVKGTYQLITLVPKYKNRDILVFFEFLDIVYYTFMFGLIVYGTILYFSVGFEKCLTSAPILAYFTQFFLIVAYVVLIILSLSIITLLVKKITTRQRDDEFDRY